MVSKRKLLVKRILIIIIAVVLAFSVVSFIATKIIHDSIFTRYDPPAIEISADLSELTKTRESYSYLSEENSLSGYLYKNSDQGGTLIVIAPGLHSTADSYLWQIKELMQLGYSVFAFDATGVNSSEGDSLRGLPQGIIDLEATLNFIEKNNRFGYNDIVLLGHSRGGYAACCVLSLGYDVSAVVSVSAPNSAMDGIIGTSKNYVSGLAYFNYGFLWLYQAMLFGPEKLNLSADKAISQSDVPVLIVHGEDDLTVPIQKYSIISHKENISSDKVSYIVRQDPCNDGHTDILFDHDGTANDTLLEDIDSFIKNALK